MLSRLSRLGPCARQRLISGRFYFADHRLQRPKRVNGPTGTSVLIGPKASDVFLDNLLNHMSGEYVLLSRERKMQWLSGLCRKLSGVGLEFYRSGRPTNPHAQHDQMRPLRSMLASLSAGSHRISTSFSRAVG